MKSQTLEKVNILSFFYLEEGLQFHLDGEGEDHSQGADYPDEVRPDVGVQTLLLPVE